MSCSRKSCSMLSSAEKQGSPDLSDRSRVTIPLHFKSNGWRENVLSLFSCKPLLVPPKSCLNFLSECNIGAYKKGGKRLLNMAFSDRTRGNRFILKMI